MSKTASSSFTFNGHVGKVRQNWPLALAAVALLLAILSGSTGKSMPLRELSVGDFEQELASRSPNQPHYYVLFNALGTTLPCPACAPSAAVLSHLNGQLQAHNNIKLATVELKSGRELFERLQLEAAPTLVYFPAGGKRAPQILDYHLTMDLSTISGWIEATSGIRIKGGDGRRRLQQACLAMVAGCLLWQFGAPLVRSRSFWAAMAGIFLLTMTNGLMWCRIREAPVHGFTASGGTQWLAPGMTAQYYSETLVLTLLQAMASLSLCLVAAHGHDPAHPWLSSLLSLMTMAITGIAYGTQMYLFRLKQPAYPFRFLSLF